MLGVLSELNRRMSLSCSGSLLSPMVSASCGGRGLPGGCAVAESLGCAEAFLKVPLLAPPPCGLFFSPVVNASMKANVRLNERGCHTSCQQPPLRSSAAPCGCPAARRVTVPSVRTAEWKGGHCGPVFPPASRDMPRHGLPPSTGTPSGEEGHGRPSELLTPSRPLSPPSPGAQGHFSDG